MNNIEGNFKKKFLSLDIENMGERVAGVERSPHAVDLVTGVRPTGTITLGNLFGALYPARDTILSHEGEISGAVFVADLHALTDTRPTQIKSRVENMVRILLALGIPPESIYLQSATQSSLLEMYTIVAPKVAVARLNRMPTLKDLTRNGKRRLNLAMLNYPVFMALDILSQGAFLVPTGPDQSPHLEFTRELAKLMNKEFPSDKLFIEPGTIQFDSVLIRDLRQPDKKMSKSNPNGAITLEDDPDSIRRKLRKAPTGMPGENTIAVQNLFLIARLSAMRLEDSDSIIEELDELYNRHLAGDKVMGQAKSIITDILIRFVGRLRNEMEKFDDIDLNILEDGNHRALQSSSWYANKLKAGYNLNY